MGILEAERRVRELSAFVTCQLRLIRNLEKRGKDLTSAQIVFDSLRVSLFLATQDLHRARCQGEPGRMPNGVDRTLSAWESKPNLVVVPHPEHHVAYGVASMKTKDGFLELAEKIDTKELINQLDTSIVPETEVEQKNDSSGERFEFRPLSEHEKNEFVNSLNAKGRQILAELAGKSKLSGESAA